MGDIYTGLVPAAVLFNNNGLTREEYAAKLFKLRPLDSIPYKGVHGVAQALGLPFTGQFLKFIESNQPSIDGNGVPIYPTSFDTEVSEESRPKIRYNISKHLDNILGKEKIEEEFMFTEIKEGKTYHPWHGGPSKLITEVLEILEETESGNQRHITAIMKVRDIQQVWDTKIYKTLSALMKSNSIFAPDNMYDFSKTQGKILLGTYTNKFYWIKKGDKYYLDKEQTFDNMQVQRYGYKDENNYNRMQLGYTDFILTAEALKHRDLGLIFNGPKTSKEPFIKKFPLARKKYCHAVWQGHVSMFGKEKGMTNSELIRYMTLGRFFVGDHNEVTKYDPSSDMI